MARRELFLLDKDILEVEKKKRKLSKEIILLLAGLSILMFFANMFFGATIPMKSEGILVWWIGVLGATVISIKDSSSPDEILISLYFMFSLFCVMTFSFLPALYAGILVGAVAFSMARAEIKNLI